VKSYPDNEETGLLAAGIVAKGGVIAFRTDTFYGLGADPLNQVAVTKIKKLKGREDSKPILLLLAEAGIADRFIVSRSELFDDVAGRFWPGPLTIVGPAVANLPVEVTAGTGTVGVRVPGAAEVRDLLRRCGGALTATSANPSGSAPARSAAQVLQYFGDEIDFVIDSGAVTVAEPSTVFDVTTSPPRVIREGAIKAPDLPG
jgi:L-threonylcarbamoyladenylate synthase